MLLFNTGLETLVNAAKEKKKRKKNQEKKTGGKKKEWKRIKLHYSHNYLENTEL